MTDHVSLSKIATLAAKHVNRAKDLLPDIRYDAAKAGECAGSLLIAAELLALIADQEAEAALRRNMVYVNEAGVTVPVFGPPPRPAPATSAPLGRPVSAFEPVEAAPEAYPGGV